MRRFLMLLKWPLIIVFGPPLLGYLYWLSGNLVDPPLEPAVSRLLERKVAAQPKDEQNAYYDLAGLDAPDDQEPQAWGRTWQEQALKIDQQIEAAVPSQARPTESKERTPPQRPRIEESKRPHHFLKGTLCQQADDCIAKVAENSDEAERIIAADAVLLRRFDSIRDRGYQEPFRPLYRFDSPLSSPPRIERLLAIRFAVLINNGQIDQALEHWAKEMAFHERRVRGSEYRESQLRAIAAMHRHHALLAGFIGARPESARTHRTVLDAALSPLGGEVLSLDRQIDNEIIAAARMALDLEFGKQYGTITDLRPGVMPRVKDFFLGRFYSSNSTANLFAAPHFKWQEILKLSGTAYRDAVRTKRAELLKQKGDIVETVLHYHNPIGHVLAQVASTADFTDILYRRDDLVAERKLLRFAIRMLEGTPLRNEQTQAAIDGDPELVHPLSGVKPGFDGTQRTLSYDPPADLGVDQSYRKIVVKL